MIGVSFQYLEIFVFYALSYWFVIGFSWRKDGKGRARFHSERISKRKTIEQNKNKTNKQH